MKKLLALMFTILLAFSPIVTAEIQMTEEAIIIPKEDFGEFLNIFMALSMYDSLINGVMGDINDLVEELRSKINDKIEVMDADTKRAFMSFLAEFSQVNSMATQYYTTVTGIAKFSDSTVGVVTKLLEMSGE